MKLELEYILEGTRLMSDYTGKSSLLGRSKFDYNMLMSVIEVIETEYFQGFPIIVTISRSGAFIAINPSNASGDKYTGVQNIANTLNINYHINPPELQYTKKEGIFVAIVQFIKFWELNKTNFKRFNDA